MKKYSEENKEIQTDSLTPESENQDWIAEDTAGQIIADLKDNLKFQKLISEISTKFVNLSSGKVDCEIENGLKVILEYMRIDRCTFAEFSQDRKKLYVTHSSYNSGFEPIVKGQIIDYFPWFGKELLRGGIVMIEKSSDIPDTAEEEKKYYQMSGLKSMLSIPVSVGGSLQCAIGFLAFKNFHSWPKYAIEQLTLLGEVFANAIYRKRAEGELKEQHENLNKQYGFEQLISTLSAKFVNLQTGQVNRQIEESLKILVDYLGVDRSTFLRISEGGNKLIPIYAYAVEDVEQVGDIPLRNWFPWATEKILHGEVVSFSSEDELPPEADLDRKNLEKLSLKSNIFVPLFLDGKVKYGFGVAAVKQPHKMLNGIAPRLKLVGEIFINALIRNENMELMQKKDKQLTVANKKISKISKQLALENRYYKTEIRKSYRSNQIIGTSGGLKYIFYRLNQVAPSNTTVLIEGETGSGKEFIARALHEQSKREDKPLIKIDCTTLHDTMIESELFGHEKGSFTGANNRHIGRIELANNATLFLDEVGEVPLVLQAKLLRVIEDGEYERLGSSQTRKVNIRVIAATNRNLEKEVKNGNFRQDLFYRLNVFPLSLPPLRERKEDIPLLADWFLEHFNKQMGKGVKEIPASVMNELQAYSWPGNVRELRNVIERAMITCEGSVLKLMDLLTVEKPLKVSPAPAETLLDMEQNYILNVLKESNWRIEGENGAAQKLGLHPDTLRSRMKKHGIRRPSANK